MIDIKNSCDEILYTITAIAAGFSLVSEILPFISSVKANGILHAIINLRNRSENAPEI
jgi:hypothetical protein